MCSKPEATESLNTSIALYEAMENPSISGDTIQGDLNCTEEIISLLHHADDLNIVTLPPNFKDKYPGTTKNIQLSPPRNETAFFAKDINDLIERDFSLLSPPSHIYIADRKITVNDDLPTNTSLQDYWHTVQLSQKLNTLADHIDHSTGKPTLIFLGKNKIAFELYAADLSNDTSESIQKFIELYNDPLHQDQKIAILRNILFEELRNLTPRERFPGLIKNFKNIQERLSDQYQYFSCEISIDQILKELDASKIEQASKINKVFADIQNQLLAIPIAIVLSASQMENTGRPGLKNFIIFSSIVVFYSIMEVLISNQLDTVSAIRSEIEDQLTILRKHTSSIFQNFEPIYSNSKRRLDKQKKILSGIRHAIRSIVCAFLVLLLYYSGWVTPIWQPTKEILFSLAHRIWNFINSLSNLPKPGGI